MHCYAAVVLRTHRLRGERVCDAAAVGHRWYAGANRESRWPHLDHFQGVAFWVGDWLANAVLRAERRSWRATHRRLQHPDCAGVTRRPFRDRNQLSRHFVARRLAGVHAAQWIARGRRGGHDGDGVAGRHGRVILPCFQTIL